MRWRRTRALLATIALLIGALVVPTAVHETDAAFTDPELVRSAQLGTVRVSPPQISAVTRCEHPLLTTVAPAVVFNWSWPSPSNMTYALTLDGTPIPETATTRSPLGVYTTTLNAGLFGTFFGGTYTIIATGSWITGGGQTWISPASTVIRVTLPTLFGNGTCTVVNGV